MMRITKDINWAVAEGTEEEIEALEDTLTFLDPTARYSPAYRNGRWDGSKKLYKKLSDGRRMFRSGIAEYVANKFHDSEVCDVIPRLAFKDSILAGLRPHQVSAVEACVGATSGIISVTTAGGKTHIAAGILDKFIYKKAMFLVHRKELMDQAYDLFSTFFKSVGRFGGGYKEDGDIIVGMVQTLAADVKKHTTGSAGKGSFLNYADISLIIIDEAQHASATSYTNVMDACVGLQLKVGLTGTVPELTGLGLLQFQSVIGSVLYDIEPQVLIEAGYIVEPWVKMFKMDWSDRYEGLKIKVEEVVKYKKENKKRSKDIVLYEKVYWDVVRDDFLVNNDARNDKIVDLCRGRIAVLVLADKLEHCRSLADKLGCVMVTGKSDNRDGIKEMFKTGQIPVLVASSIYDEGVDIPSVRTVVMASGGKAMIKLCQRVGRGMRTADGKDHVDIFDIYDTGIPLLERHTKERMRHYKTKGYPVEIID